MRGSSGTVLIAFDSMRATAIDSFAPANSETGWPMPTWRLLISPVLLGPGRGRPPDGGLVVALLTAYNT